MEKRFNYYIELNIGILFRLFFFLVITVCYSNTLKGEWIDVSPKGLNLQETIYDISFIDHDTAYAVGWSSSRSIILKTVNAGRDWQMKDFKGFYFFSVQADNNLIVIAGYSARCMCGVLYYSTDNGEKWDFYEFEGDKKPLTFSASKIRKDANDIYFLTGHNGVVFYSDDYCESWYYSNTKNTTDIFRDIKMIDNLNFFSIAGKNSNVSDKIYLSKNSGKSWDIYSSFEDQQISFTGVHFFDGSEGFIFGIAQGQEAIIYTKDGGKNWNSVYQGEVGKMLFDGLFINKTTGFTAKQKGIILQTTDGGNEWFEAQLPTTNDIKGFNACCGDRQDVVYAYGSNGTILKSSNLSNVENSKSIITLSPNPANINISLEIPEPYFYHKAEIYNLMGERILTIPKIEKKNFINVDFFLKGIYFVVLYNRYGNFHTLKFQKN